MLVSGLLGLFGSILYGSFLEWFVHKIVMHTNKLSQLAFDRHAVEHHTHRRSLKSFYAQPEDNESYHLGESSIIPLLWLVHVPMYLAVGKFGGVAAGIGAGIGGMLYLIGYEFIHFFVHAPRNYHFQRTRLFRFYCEYHRVHHGRARVNYNVVMPLADFVLRTQSFETIREEPSRHPEMPGDTGPLSAFRRRRNPAKSEA
jgi:hypothetical protein